MDPSLVNIWSICESCALPREPLRLSVIRFPDRVGRVVLDRPQRGEVQSGLEPGTKTDSVVMCTFSRELQISTRAVYSSTQSQLWKALTTNFSRDALRYGIYFRILTKD